MTVLLPGHRPDREGIRTSGWPGKLIRLGVVQSTNALALAAVGGAWGDDFAVVAREQTDGRGRLGRSWLSPAGKGLYCSVALRPQAESARLPQLTLVMAVAAIEAVAAATGARLAIKWPNDLYYRAGKVGGILAEIKPDPEGGREAVVVGVGINLSQRREDFDPGFADAALSLATITGGEPDDRRLLTSLLDHFHLWRLLWEREGFARVRARWLEYDCTLGKRVTIPGEAAAVKAVVEDIDAAGGLWLREVSGRRRRVVADDIVLERH